MARSAKYQAEANVTSFTDSVAPVGAIYMVTDACGVGYDGPFCSNCTAGFYKFDNRLCLACAADDTTTLAIIVAFIVLSLFFAVTILLPSSRFGLVVGVILLLQRGATVGRLAAPMLSPYPALLDFFSFVVHCSPTFFLSSYLVPLHILFLKFQRRHQDIFNFELAILKPGCSLPAISFENEFYGTLAFFLALSVLSALGYTYLINYTCATHRSQSLA